MESLKSHKSAHLISKFWPCPALSQVTVSSSSLNCSLLCHQRLWVCF